MEVSAHEHIYTLAPVTPPMGAVSIVRVRDMRQRVVRHTRPGPGDLSNMRRRDVAPAFSGKRNMKRLTLAAALCAAACIPVAVAPSSADMLGVWWKIVEACSGQKADLEAWTFAVSHDTVIHIYAWPYGMVDAWGNTEPGSHVIVLSARGAACPKIVRHEMLHAIDPRYDATHPESIYVKCKGIVAPPFTDARDC